MYDFYTNIRSTNDRVKKCSVYLNNIYDQIPRTQGCMESISKENGCGAWCCRIQTPQFLYSEFLNAWNYISKNFSTKEGSNLIERCMINAVEKCPSKQCVFFNPDTKLCMIHKVRPYNCRAYGITPAEEFNPRFERLKKEYSEIPCAIVRNQCDLVKTENGREVTTLDTDKWWKKLVEVERKLGIPKKYINDGEGGSYRSPHDHILLYLMPPNVLNALAGIRMYTDDLQKRMAIKDLMYVIRRLFPDE